MISRKFKSLYERVTEAFGNHLKIATSISYSSTDNLQYSLKQKFGAICLEEKRLLFIGSESCGQLTGGSETLYKPVQAKLGINAFLCYCFDYTQANGSKLLVKFFCS